MYCKRCKNRNPFLFKKILCTHDKCYYCLKCCHISIFKLCDSIKNDLSFINVKINTKFNLTNKQKQIVKQVFTQFKAKKNVFINAVCGAGKTNIIMPIISKFINHNLKVAFVCPRTEVINEQFEKFSSIFKCKIGILTGQKKCTEGAFFLLTTHQLLNYKNMFHLIIVDEFDAFPLHGDKILSNGIKDALIYNNFLVYLSATPIKVPKSFITLNLNRRFHNFDLPVPQLESLCFERLNKLLKRDKWIVFFPTIKLLEESIKKIENIEFEIVHSQIQHCFNINSRIILSTAILERGITIPNINVIVMYCDHINYTMHTLIQMAGRVGRIPPYISGRVIYMANNITLSQTKAIKHIKWSNTCQNV